MEGDGNVVDCIEQGALLLSSEHEGRAPSELDWRRPALMENVLRRYSGGTPGLDGDFVREPRLVYGKIELNLERVPEIATVY